MWAIGFISYNVKIFRFFIVQPTKTNQQPTKNTNFKFLSTEEGDKEAKYFCAVGGSRSAILGYY